MGKVAFAGTGYYQIIVFGIKCLKFAVVAALMLFIVVRLKSHLCAGLQRSGTERI